MKLIQQLNEAAGKLELHVDGHPRRAMKGDLVRGFIYDPNKDKEEEVVIHYDYEKAGEADHYNPAHAAQVVIHKVVKPGGGEFSLDKLDLRDAEAHLHDLHKD